MAVLTLISCFRKFRKKAIVEEKPLCAVLWRVFARGCLAWLAHPNGENMEKRCLRCRHESFVGLSPNEKKILPEARTARQDAASGELSRRVKELDCLLQSFLEMLRERQPERLNGWMKQARESGVKELDSFVVGIERDYDAVRAGLTFPWSQGPVEGTVNKIKTHKRLLYGRASFTLLRQKLLHLTCFFGGFTNKSHEPTLRRR